MRRDGGASLGHRSVLGFAPGHRRAGPRYDGTARLTVFREDWGFSAIVEPARLRIVSDGNTTTLTERSAASLPQAIETGDPVVELTLVAKA
jgi:hypothetical protein